MSQKNVEIVRSLVDAWNRRDLDAMIALTHPRIEYVNAPTAVEPGTQHGHDGLAAVVRAQWEFSSDSTMAIRRSYDRGDEIIALVDVSRPMPGSDYSVDAQGLMACSIKDGKVLRVEVLAGGPGDVRDALEAAGLSE